jgi:cytochrome c-type biogenesis protein CcmH/NrfG
MMNKKTQRIVGGVIAVLVTLSMVGAGMFGYFIGGDVPPAQTSASSADADVYQSLKSQVENLKQQVAANPDDIEIKHDLGKAYFNLAISAMQTAPAEMTEDFNQAIKNFQNVLETRKDINVLTDLAVAAFYNEQNDLAEQTFKEALSLQPDFEQALFYYGIFLQVVKQDHTAAIGMWQKALNNNPTGSNADLFKQYITRAESMLNQQSDP